MSRIIDSLRARTGIWMLSSTAVWAVVTTYGEALNGAHNSACYALLGCNSGFFGYDALEHLLFGFAAVWILMWLWTFPRISMMNLDFWKTALILVAIIALISVGWEILECFRDAFLLDILHEPLLNFRLHIDLLDQPNNLDTMGDLSFSLLGSLLTLPFLQKN